MAIDDLLDEHEQSERVRTWLRQNGAGIFGGVVLALAVIGGVMFILLETHFRALRLYESARDEVTIRNFI